MSMFLNLKMLNRDSFGCRRGETNQQRFYCLWLCFVGFLFLAVVHQVFLCILDMFRCCYICYYMHFHGCACCFVATWSSLSVAT
jgi:hypothetical protein